MSFVYTISTSEVPCIARGPVPLEQWDLWVDSGERLRMVADAPDESVWDQPQARFDWLQGKALEWFGVTVQWSKAHVSFLDEGRVQVEGLLIDVR